MEVRAATEGYAPPPDDSAEWNSTSKDGGLSAFVDETKINVVPSGTGGALLEIRNGLPSPYGTRYHSAFDDAAKHLAVSSHSRTGTYARIWNISREPEAATEEFVAELSTSDLLLVPSSVPSGGKPWKASMKMKIDLLGNAGEGVPPEEIIWEITAAPREPVAMPPGEEPVSSFEEEKDIAALNRLGWSLRTSADETPYRLADSAGKEFPLDHGGYANSYSYDVSETGRRVATGGEDKMAKIWNVGKGSVNPGATLQHPRSVWHVRFSNDENFLLTATGSGGNTSDPEIRVWEVSSGKLLAGPWTVTGDFGNADISPDLSHVWCRYHPEDPDGGGGENPSVTVCWQLSPGSHHSSETLADLAEAIGGRKVWESGSDGIIPIRERIGILRSIRSGRGKSGELPSYDFSRWYPPGPDGQQ